MTKRIQIPLELYELMVSYICDHFDPGDQARFSKIYCGIEAKQTAATRHNLFTVYVTQKEPETREVLRKAYLSEIGITEDSEENH